MEEWTIGKTRFRLGCIMAQMAVVGSGAHSDGNLDLFPECYIPKRIIADIAYIVQSRLGW